MKETISIIIPAYNVQDCLGATLDSVLAQTYGNLEVIVVDDGSTDGTAKIIDAYAARDSRVKAIHKKNGGVTSARLEGLSQSTGAYIGFVDGDDFVEPKMYERLYENIKKYDADISHCGYQMVFPDGRVDDYYNTGKTRLQQGVQGCSDLLNGEFIEPGLVNKLYCRELFSGLDAWMDRSIRMNEDLLMNFYLFRQAKMAVFEDICPYHYVLRKGSAATARLNPHKLRDPVSVLHILHRETINTPEWNSIVERRLIRQLVNSATMQLGNESQLIEPFRREARQELRQRLGKTLHENTCSRKLKIMALWAAVWPSSYGLVHRIYAKAAGVDKKYRVE